MTTTIQECLHVCPRGGGVYTYLTYKHWVDPLHVKRLHSLRRKDVRWPKNCHKYDNTAVSLVTCLFGSAPIDLLVLCKWLLLLLVPPPGLGEPRPKNSFLPGYYKALHIQTAADCFTASREDDRSSRRLSLPEVSGPAGSEAELPPGCYLVERVIAARKYKVCCATVLKYYVTVQ